MTTTTCWHTLTREIIEKFPQADPAYLLSHQGDIGALVRHVSDVHDLTFAEAAETVTFRIPQYIEPERLSA